MWLFYNWERDVIKRQMGILNLNFGSEYSGEIERGMDGFQYLNQNFDYMVEDRFCLKGRVEKWRLGGRYICLSKGYGNFFQIMRR